MNPTITGLKCYVPSEDFELSKRFYSELGFEMTEAWAGDVDCKLGGAEFRLQNYYNKDWAENFMIKFEVEDVDAWHRHAGKIIDDGDFGNARYDTPEVVGGDTKIFHVWDPCGVLLIFIQ